MAKEILVIHDHHDLLEQIEAVVRRVVKEEIAKSMEAAQKKQTEANSPKYLSRKEVIELLGISYAKLHRMTNLGILPCVMCGRKPLYKLSDVQKSLTKLNTK